MFCKNGVLKNFVKFPGKHLCQVSYSFSAATLLKKRLWHSFFSVNFVKFLKTHFYSAPLVASSTNQMYQNQIEILHGRFSSQYIFDGAYFYWDRNCVKSVRISSYYGPHFPAFGLNTEEYSVSLHT